MREYPQKTELSSRGWAPCSTGFLHSVSVLGTHLYQCTSWCCCERLHLASVNFSEDSFNVFAHVMMGDLGVHVPTPHWVFSSFWPKMAWSPCPHSLYSPNLAPRGIYCFPRLKKKVLKGKCFANMEKVRLKTAEALKHIKIGEFENCFEQ